MATEYFEITKFTVKKSKNIYKVPQKQWKQWSIVGKVTFNYMFSLLFNDFSLFKHPKQELPSSRFIKTTAWNAAWIAADCATAADKGKLPY